MEHIPFALDPAFTNLIWALILVGGILGFVGVVPLTIGRAKRKTFTTVLLYVSAGAGFIMLSSAAISLTHSPSASKSLEVEWRAEVAAQFTEHYSTKVTAENIAELRYPKAAPEGRVPLGTTTLPGTGREVALVFNEGRAYLRIIGEELPFD